MKYIKYYLLQLMMIATMLVFAFAFAQFAMGRDTSMGVISLYIALSVFYLFSYFFLRRKIRQGGKSAEDIFHLLQTEEIYNMLHIFNEKVGIAFTFIMALGSVLVYFLKH
ncbi:hypothetical protein [Faecalispora anaeroviscerum]|uniref:hypothetical protein n=1 Tax=Faecalispora anaeroviscerum TaxID=2991836 RepID=UPI0024BAFE52|nr:hypothetical protein [Faecalispora anaeroviscerum]